MPSTRHPVDLVERSADPAWVRAAMAQLVQARPNVGERLAGDDRLTAAVVSLTAVSRAATALIRQDPAAIEVLADLDVRPAPDRSGADSLARWKRRELLRIAARDLLGIDTLEQTVAAISATAVDVLAAAVELADADLSGGSGLAVVAMGKLGGDELNYASDIDLVLVGAEAGEDSIRAARRVLAIAGRSWPIDTALRPEGRDGVLVRTLDGYRAHWERWAEPWEFQALLKARPVAGDRQVGGAFAAAAAEQLWDRPFDAQDLRSLRALKARTEEHTRRTHGFERDVKQGPGGIRDIEFSLQLLQLVHGRHDDRLRVTNTLTALARLTEGGYVDAADADWLHSGYRFLRRVEHRLQVDGDRPQSSVPPEPTERQRLARSLGFRDGPSMPALEAFDSELRACRATVRLIHQRLYFRPLLEAFASSSGPLGPEATDARLAAFGFTHPARTRQAVDELTRGLTRSSQLMQQLLPLVLDWLSTAPDPDVGLLGLRGLASGPTRSMRLAHAFRESPDTAWRLCRVLGTSAKLAGLLARNPDLIDELSSSEQLTNRTVDQLTEAARSSVDLRVDETARRKALHRFTDREGFRISAHDVLGLADTRAVGGALARLAEAALRTAVAQADPQVPLAVVAVGRLGGSELSYASDLDLVLVHGGEGPDDQAEAERATRALLHFLGGDTPSALVYDIDLDLRPEGRNGPVVRSLDSYRAYFDRWAHTWERQAMLRARVVAGDHDLGERLLADLAPIVWQPLTDEDRRAIRRMKARIESERVPVGEDPEFHLKLGPGAMTDVEFCTQLLQLEHSVRGTGTLGAIAALADAGALSGAEAETLDEAYRFCVQARNRWFLIKGSPSDALPQGHGLEVLARSLDTTATDLREHYRRVTRRARTVVDRRFYGLTR